MRKWLTIITLMLCMIPIVYGAGMTCQVSEDNATWTSIEAQPYGGSINGDYAKVPYLEQGTVYYFRCMDDAHAWSYTSTKTEQGGFNEMILTVGLIFLFITGLVVFAIWKAKPMWLKTSLALLLSIMLMTLFRLSSWFVHISNPEELELINTLDHFYMFGVWGFRMTVIASIFILLILVINVMNMKRNKKNDDWSKWGED